MLTMEGRCIELLAFYYETIRYCLLHFPCAITSLSLDSYTTDFYHI